MAKFGMHKVVFTLVIDPSEDGDPNDMTLWTFLYSIIHSTALWNFLLHLLFKPFRQKTKRQVCGVYDF